MRKMHPVISQAHDTAMKNCAKPVDAAYYRERLDRNRTAEPIVLRGDACDAQEKWRQHVRPNMEQAVKNAGCNPFRMPADAVLVDLLTDSGTSKLTGTQKRLSIDFLEAVPSQDVFAYAGSSARASLDEVIANIFGENFFIQPSLQGRSAEGLLLNSLVANGILSSGNVIISNRPFDTTKGHIENVKTKVIACTPLTTPSVYANAENVFLGNMNLEKMVGAYDQAPEKAKAVLLTVTDNGGGGQPVSMENIRQVTAFAKERGLLVWVDACRIFENALFIKLYEPGYENKTLVEIAQEILSNADMVTMSFKKMYSHTGSAILLNQESQLLGGKLGAIKRSLQELSTVLYGMGFETGYCGLNGDKMVEVISGLHLAIDPEMIAARVGQISNVYAILRDLGFPVVGGAHAFYVAADQVFPEMNLVNAPAEYLQALGLAALGIRGCGLGNRLYAKWKQNGSGWEIDTPAEMDSLRYAVPRLVYGDASLNLLSILALAHKQGVFAKATYGLEAVDYNTSGFYHFGGYYNVRNEQEFSRLVNEIREVERRQ